MDRRELLGSAVALAALMPPLQEAEGLLGIPWWVWLVVIVVLLLLLLIGLVMKQEPGPPIENQSPRPYPVARPAATTEDAGPAVSAHGVAAEEVAEEEPAPEQPQPEPEAKAETAAAADDLKRIEGIGPKVESLLETAGIRTFAQLAAAEPDRLREVLAASDLQMIDPASWPEQARLAAEGNWEEFEKLTERLKGGRGA